MVRSLADRTFQLRHAGARAGPARPEASVRTLQGSIRGVVRRDRAPEDRCVKTTRGFPSYIIEGWSEETEGRRSSVHFSL